MSAVPLSFADDWNDPAMDVYDLDAALAEVPPEPETAISTATPRKCRRHGWVLSSYTFDPVEGQVVLVDPARMFCWRCNKPRDDARVRRGRSNRRLGGDTERRIERRYGPRKVGEYGDAIDHMGRDWAWQSKASRKAPPQWMESVDEPVVREPTKLVTRAAAAMAPIVDGRAPLVIQTFVAPKRTRDWLWVRAADWSALHGGGTEGWLVMSGMWWLQTHGTDEP